MSLFISDAMAETASDAAASPGLTQFIPLIIIFVIFYFLLIRPQMKRAKEHKTMVASIAKGEEVVTNGGILGKIVSVDEGFFSLEVANGTVIKMQTSSVSQVMPKGTYKPA
ncbi:MAG: preprotein translocase subunit YajC [Gammaproteobacteria bacterium]|nr:preprotein translocase subunit YajC [Gammaproteobacteria bacterium]PCH63051.1 MAG: preprotein translocase subunit YajC [Gammaproteobacteria bacterium]